MHHDQRRCAEFQSARRDFAGIDGRLIDRSLLHDLVLDQTALIIQKQHAESFRFPLSHIRAAIRDKLVPAVNDGRVRYSVFQHPQRRFPNDQEQRHRRIFDPRYAAKRFRRSGDHRFEIAENLDHLFCQRFNVASGYRRHQQSFEQFIILQRSGAEQNNLLTEPVAMTGIIRFPSAFTGVLPVFIRRNGFRRHNAAPYGG